MKSCRIVTKDTLRGRPGTATILVGGGWSGPHPGWGYGRHHTGRSWPCPKRAASTRGTGPVGRLRFDADAASRGARRDQGIVMDTRQLAAFCAVVERRSFSQAAERLGVTQPAVSLQVRALEERLGTQLLDRSGRRVEPTEAGTRLYRGAQRLLALEEQVLDDVALESERRAQRHASTSAPRPVPAGSSSRSCSASSSASNPELRVALSPSPTRRRRRARRRRASSSSASSARGAGTAASSSSRSCATRSILAVPPGHAFAGRDGHARRAARRRRSIVMQEGAGVRQMIEDELRAVGVRLRDLDVTPRARPAGVRKSAVQAGYGVAFISRTAIEAELAAGTLASAPGRRARARARDPARPRDGPDADARRARRSSSSRASGLETGARSSRRGDRPLGARRAAGRPRRARPEAAAPRRRAPRWDGSTLPHASRAGPKCRPDRIEVPPGADCDRSRSAAAARSTRPRRPRR